MSDSVATGFGQVVEVLKTSGPWGLAVLGVYWGYMKEKEKTEATDKAQERNKASYDQLVTIVQTVTTAMVKMESAVTSLEKVMTSLMNERRT